MSLQPYPINNILFRIFLKFIFVFKLPLPIDMLNNRNLITLKLELEANSFVLLKFIEMTVISKQIKILELCLNKANFVFNLLIYTVDFAEDSRD